MGQFTDTVRGYSNVLRKNLAPGKNSLFGSFPLTGGTLFKNYVGMKRERDEQPRKITVLFGRR